MMIPELNLNFTDAYSALRPLALFAAGVAVYGILVFHFYRFLARKDILKLDLSKHNRSRRPLLRKIISVIFYILESLMLFPILIFFWFLVMAGLLFLMNSDRSIESILLAAMGVVAAIRVSSYYNATLATDVAKILPLALLGIMLIDSSLIGLSESTEGIREAAVQWETMIYYLIGVVVLEFALRMVSAAWGLFRGTGEAADPLVETPGPRVDPIGASTGTDVARADGSHQGPPEAPGHGGAAASGSPSAKIGANGP